MPALYDQIGVSYSIGRREDPRIADLIVRAVGDSRSIVNVGAGSGSYEPVDRFVVSVEPSSAMIAQRKKPSPRNVQAKAERLPFRDGSFDCALAVLTIHHWSPALDGLAELRRIARKIVILSWDQDVWEHFWLFDYVPSLRQQDRQRAIAIATVVSALGSCTITPVLIPHDCMDGFQGAFWRRPAAYLDSAVRQRMSGFAQSSVSDYENGLSRLAIDLREGDWRRKYSAILERGAIDLGYRLIVADASEQ